MRLIDRIALQRAISMLLGFIISLVEVFQKSKKDEEEEQPQPKPEPRRRPLRDLLDNIFGDKK